MTVIHFDGFYGSKPAQWEDWDAGVRMHGEHVHYPPFFPNQTWVSAYRDIPFDFWSHSNALDKTELDSIRRGRGPTDADANPLWIAGTFEVNGDELVQSMSPDIGGGYVWVTRFAILQDRIVGPEKRPVHLLFNPAKVSEPGG